LWWVLPRTALDAVCPRAMLAPSAPHASIDAPTHDARAHLCAHTAAAAGDVLERRQLGYLLARQGVPLNLEEGPTAVEVSARACARACARVCVCGRECLAHADAPGCSPLSCAAYPRWVASVAGGGGGPPPPPPPPPTRHASRSHTAASRTCRARA
jgi:hypothetical protein